MSGELNYKTKKSEFEIVSEFTNALDLQNKTDGTLFIYKPKKGVSTKPDGYYYYDGITFILDAKEYGGKFEGQLEDYMSLESNENYIGFKYNGVKFECYIKGKLEPTEKEIQDKDYYKQKYFPLKTNNEQIVEKSAKKLANLFRDSKIDKQMNVPFIGAVMLCIKFGQQIDTATTANLLTSLKLGLNKIIPNDGPLEKKQKREFIQTTLQDATLKKAKITDLFTILQEISTIYNFINISQSDLKGHDIMNSFLKIFRKWNSANSNEKGEVFTPDHIAQLMYVIAKCSKNSIILDPTCGSGTFLTNAMANMWAETTSNEEQINISLNQLFGIESNTFNATLAGINMMLHGDGASHIYNADCFTKLPDLYNCYDRVLMNPPFSQVDNELKFVFETLENMLEDGYLSAIVPKSCVKGTEQKNVDYLKKIFEMSNLISVVSLPNDLFAPNAGVATCIITFQKTNKAHSSKTLLVNLSDDGYELTKNSGRVDTGSWSDYFNEVVEIFNIFEKEENKEEIKFDDKKAVVKTLNFSDELLFESYSSYRPLTVSKETFSRYIREYISSKILCGMNLNNTKLNSSINTQATQQKKFKISELLEDVAKGKVKSIDRKLEDKFDLSGTPLIIAKKDNNGIGGMKQVNQFDTYEDKFCIITGGDGGGGKTYYCDFEFSATNFVLICDLVQKYKGNVDRYAKLYLAIVVSERLHKTVNHGRTIKTVPSNIDIELPIKEDETIDFGYMSDYIKSLQYSEFI